MFKRAAEFPVNIERQMGRKTRGKGNGSMEPLIGRNRKLGGKASLLASSASCGAGGQKNYFLFVWLWHGRKIKAVVHAKGKQNPVFGQGGKFCIKTEGKALISVQDSIGQLKKANTEAVSI